MGISERREREKDERRRMILNCARELILSQGVQNISMEDIARKAELSKATVYLYFSSKEILLNEICEEAARGFIDQSKLFLEPGVTGMAALKCFWSGYEKLFGNLEEMIIIFQVRNFMNPGLPLISLDERSESPNVDAILNSMRETIDQCKAEGVFDPNLDSLLATRFLLSMFSVTVENAARMRPEDRKSPFIINEMKNIFQIIVRGFAREGIDRSLLNITES